jgi:branched-chain amino acid transport system substrate-binding protein
MIPQFTRPDQKDWVKRFKKRFGYNPSPSAAGQGYDYAKYFVKIAKRAIEKYGQLDSETVTKIGREEVLAGKLKYTTADGALMHAAYGTDADSAPDPTIGPDDFFFPVLQYKNGKGYAVFPPNMKEADFITPK